MLRNVTILYRGSVIATVRVELLAGSEDDFVLEAMTDAIRQGTFDGRRPQEIEFTVSAPSDEDEVN